MKNVIVGILTLVIFGLMALTYSGGGAYHGGELGKVIEDFKSTKQTEASQKDAQAKRDKEEQEKIQALRDKAGNIGDVKISKAYKTKCSACHGVDGSGYQNGRKLMGPKVYGQDSETIYKKLVDFKAGRIENVIMKGLLINTTEDELRKFADEIGAFSSQEKK